MKVGFFDPGLRYLGWGVIELAPTRSRALGHGVLGESTAERHWSERLDDLAVGIARVLNSYLPDVLGYEDQAGVEVAMQREGSGSNYSSRRLHEVCGMIRYAARNELDAPLPCYAIQPRSIKVAVLGKGHGSAEKSVVQAAIRRLLGVDGSSHEADALAGAVAASQRHRVELLKLRRSAGVIR